MHPKDWIPVIAKQWAAARRRIDNGGDSKGHRDGWPTATILGKIKEEAAGAGQGARKQHFPEVFTGDVLLLRRSMEGMPIAQREVFEAHFLSSDPVRIRADELGVSVATYWNLLDGAYLYVAGRFSLLEALDKRTA